MEMDVVDDSSTALHANGNVTRASAGSQNTSNGENDNSTNVNEASSKDVCEECEDRRSVWYCPSCGGVFCDVCFYALHRKGKRVHHKPERITHSSGEGTGASRGGSRLLGGLIGSRASTRGEVNPDMYDR